MYVPLGHCCLHITTAHRPDKCRHMLMCGLNDSSTKVREAASSMLVQWLGYLQGDDKIHALLDKLDVTRYPGKEIQGLPLILAF